MRPMARASHPPGDPVKCVSCGHVNTAAARFCGGCGGSLAVAPECPACGEPAAGNQRYCTACGTGLTPKAPGTRPDTHAPPEPLAEKARRAAPDLQGERKQVTVL